MVNITVSYEGCTLADGTCYQLRAESDFRGLAHVYRAECVEGAQELRKNIRRKGKVSRKFKNKILTLRILP